MCTVRIRKEFRTVAGRIFLGKSKDVRLKKEENGHQIALFIFVDYGKACFVFLRYCEVLDKVLLT